MQACETLMKECVNVDFILPSSEVAERLCCLVLYVLGGGRRPANINKIVITGKVLCIFEDRMMTKI